MIWISIAAMGLVVILSWTLYRHVGASRIEAFTNKRRSTSRMVGRGEFVDGNRHLQVALALTSTDLFYENADMQASLDLRWVREIEYDVSLATGHAIANGKVLRIRCLSQVFEFVVPSEDVVRWHMMLPPRRGSGPLADLAAPVAIAT